MALNSKPNSKSYPLELSRSALWVRGEIVLIRNSLLVHVSCYQIVVEYSEGSIIGSLLTGINFFILSSKCILISDSRIWHVFVRRNKLHF